MEPDIKPDEQAAIILLRSRGYNVHVKKKKNPSKPIVTIDREDMDTLLAQARPGYAGTRDRAMIELMWATGLRVGEVVALEPGDYEVSASGKSAMIHVRVGKTGARDVPVRLVEPDGSPTPLKSAFDAYLPIRRGGMLFTTGTGKPMNRSILNDALARYSRECGMGKHVHSHTMRHSFATRELADGRSEIEVSRLLGHKSLSMTNRYIQGSVAIAVQRRMESE